MQKVISNSSSIIHLAKIGKLQLLKEYFGTITVPEAVFKECVAEGKGRDEIEIIKNADWIKALPVNDRNLVKLLRAYIDDGEAEAITLSLEIGADLILIDETEAREKARLYGLKISGTIGILLRAKFDGKIDSLKENLIRLKETGFRISNELMTKALMEVNEI